MTVSEVTNTSLDAEKVLFMQHIHFIAIGGQGMSGVASVLLKRGFRVSGSDLVETDLVLHLRRQGAVIHIGHRRENLEEPDTVVISSAIHEDNPELMAAREKGIPVVHRMDMLLTAVLGKRIIAVAGAHGKTTTTSMISWILLEDGKDPTFFVGGEFAGEGTSHQGTGDIAVFETDESDGSFLKVKGDIHMVTNIDNDHLDYWGSMESLRMGFYEYLDNTQPDGLRIVCQDDPTLRDWAKGKARVETYGFSEGATWRLVDFTPAGWGSAGRLLYKGEEVGKLVIKVPGRHTAQNALGAFVAARLGGVETEIALAHLSTYPGVKRRLERLGEFGGVLLLDDFAHHPREIAATIAAIRETLPGRRLVVAFQPHRYSRTKMLRDDFGSALAKADEVFVLGIYAGPGESPEGGVSSEFIADAVREHGLSNVSWIEDKAMVVGKASSACSPGDVLLTMGAGDVWKMYRDVAKILTREGQ